MLGGIAEEFDNLPMLYLISLNFEWRRFSHGPIEGVVLADRLLSGARVHVRRLALGLGGAAGADDHVFAVLPLPRPLLRHPIHRPNHLLIRQLPQRLVS